jgi:hypothetical protein
MDLAVTQTSTVDFVSPDRSALLTIGQAARLAGVTTKPPRHYDHIALLRPAVVDPATGTGVTARITSRRRA